MLDQQTRDRRGRRERQVEFAPEQRHHRLVTPVMWGISLLCILIVVIIVSTDTNGPFIGPWG
jgi:hypothetical protein